MPLEINKPTPGWTVTGTDCCVHSNRPSSLIICIIIGRRTPTLPKAISQGLLRAEGKPFRIDRTHQKQISFAWTDWRASVRDPPGLLALAGLLGSRMMKSEMGTGVGAWVPWGKRVKGSQGKPRGRDKWKSPGISMAHSHLKSCPTVS